MGDNFKESLGPHEAVESKKELKIIAVEKNISGTLIASAKTVRS